MQLGADLARFGVEVLNPVWRVSLKRYDPLTAPPANAQIHGRFDDPFDEVENSSDTYSVLYCAETSVAAFIEATGVLRARLGAVDELVSQTLLSVDERELSSAARKSSGVVTRNWQHVNHLTSGRIVTSAPLFDLTRAEAVQTLRLHLAPSIIAMGLDDLDFGELLGSNRTLTQAISRWIWSMTTDSDEPLFAGIRYRSRFDPDCICLALFNGRFFVDGDIVIQPINAKTPGFAAAASTLRLHIA